MCSYNAGEAYKYNNVLGGDVNDDEHERTFVYVV